MPTPGGNLWALARVASPMFAWTEFLPDLDGFEFSLTPCSGMPRYRAETAVGVLLGRDQSRDVHFHTSCRCDSPTREERCCEERRHTTGIRYSYRIRYSYFPNSALYTTASYFWGEHNQSSRMMRCKVWTGTYCRLC